MKKEITFREKRERDEKWEEVQRRYHENRRRLKARGELPDDRPTRASSCCNEGIVVSVQAVICKKCGKAQT